MSATIGIEQVKGKEEYRLVLAWSGKRIKVLATCKEEDYAYMIGSSFAKQSVATFVGTVQVVEEEKPTPYEEIKHMTKQLDDLLLTIGHTDLEYFEASDLRILEARLQEAQQQTRVLLEGLTQ